MKFKNFRIDDSPGFILHLTDTKMKAGLLRAFHQQGLKITPEQWGLLSRLWEEEGIHQNALAKKTAKDKHTITRMLNLLQKNRLIERRPDPEDRRCIKIYLTEEGKALKDKLTPIVIDFLDKIFQGLTQKDLKEFRRIHVRIIRNLEMLHDD